MGYMATNFLSYATFTEIKALAAKLNIEFT